MEVKNALIAVILNDYEHYGKSNDDKVADEPAVESQQET